MISIQAKKYLILAALQAFIAVAAGAFGAHGLKNIVGPHELVWWETGCRYLMYHALAGLCCAFAIQQFSSLKISVLLFSFGNLFFTGSLFIMTLTGITWLGAITPIGGTLYLLGWGYMVWKFMQIK